MSDSVQDIRKPSELTALISNGIIKSNVVVRGAQLISLLYLRQVKGSLGLSETTLEDLGQLEIVEGDFWTSNHTTYLPLKTLGRLRIVHGDLTLRYSNIESLGSLEEVGGRLSLRDTPISDFGNLALVKGDLFLPARFKRDQRLENIQVEGRIRFWKDSKDHNPIEPDNQTLADSERPIPEWPYEYIMSFSQLTDQNRQVKDFYQYFREEFFKGTYINLRGNDNYLFTLLREFTEVQSTILSSEELLTHSKNFAIHYPMSTPYLPDMVIDKAILERNEDTLKATIQHFNPRISFESCRKISTHFSDQLINQLFLLSENFIESILEWEVNENEERKDWKNAWQKRLANGMYDFDIAVRYDELLGPGIIDGQVLCKVLDQTALTEYGKRNTEPICTIASTKILKIESEEGKPISKTVWWTEMSSLFIGILREAENEYRESQGVPKIGEGWVFETELYYAIKEAFPETEVVQHASPEWLGRQHLDVYLPEFNIAIEYQGKQHYEPVEFFGGKEAFERTKERDDRKRLLCNENGCELFYVNCEAQHHDIINLIKRLLTS